MGVFNNILMTHFLEGVDLFRFIRVNLHGSVSLWKISHRPQHLLHSLGKHLKFLSVSAAISTVKLQAHARILHRRNLCWDIMWAVMMSVTSWPCHTHQNKVPVHFSWFLQGNKGKMNTCVISTCVSLHHSFQSRGPLVTHTLSGLAPHDNGWCRCLFLEHCLQLLYNDIELFFFFLLRMNIFLILYVICWKCSNWCRLLYYIYCAVNLWLCNLKIMHKAELVAGRYFLCRQCLVISAWFRQDVGFESHKCK